MNEVKKEPGEPNTQEHEPSTEAGGSPDAVELNDTGAGMPLSLGGGGYGGSEKTVHSPADDKDKTEQPQRKS